VKAGGTLSGAGFEGFVFPERVILRICTVLYFGQSCLQVFDRKTPFLCTGVLGHWYFDVMASSEVAVHQREIPDLLAMCLVGTDPWGINNNYTQGQ
jgi:hypothetical protein